MDIKKSLHLKFIFATIRVLEKPFGEETDIIGGYGFLENKRVKKSMYTEKAHAKKFGQKPDFDMKFFFRVPFVCTIMHSCAYFLKVLIHIYIFHILVSGHQ